MALRPSRPGRPVPFRPFSSRDAHVMLQLKRSSEVVLGSRVKTIFDAALSAGKAARDVHQVPDIRCLKGYGSGGKYSVEPPEELMKKSEDAAKTMAIEPAVQKCKEKFRALDSASLVSTFRENIMTALTEEGFDLDNNTNDRHIVRSYLHKPCIDLRKGVAVDEAAVLSELRINLRRNRQTSE